MPLKNLYVQSSRKSRQGDWICICCSNYNFTFRKICKQLNDIGNRCHYQTKEANDKVFATLGTHYYGEKSFPSAVFVNECEGAHQHQGDNSLQ